MPSNDLVLLKEILQKGNQETAPELDESDYFELFVATELLKDYQLSYDEVAAGLIGGSNDGGVDGFHFFANGELVHEDSDLSALKKNVNLELIVVQAKRSRGFREEPINKLQAVTNHLLDLANDLEDYKDRYCPELIAAAELFRSSYQELAGSFPTLSVRFVYASFADEVHSNVESKAADLKQRVVELFSSAEPTFDFLGSEELLALARSQPKTSFSLALAETPISAGGAVAYVCLVNLEDFFDFVSDDQGALRSELFEANVRDYQGRTEVNREIRDSLARSDQEDFWWLNNGVTIVAAQATQSGKTLNIEDPQIVNGLQTSRQIFEYFKAGAARDQRLILVRIVVPDAEDSRDRIIKATNSQTYIPPASLKATDKVQRDIEDYLKARGLFYDRRKNYYRNQGKPVAKIVGIPKMAQALMAIVLARPDTARARPSSLIKNDSDYSRLFNESHPVEMYLTCIQILRRSEDHLKQRGDLESKDRNNLRFYVALEVAREITSQMRPTLESLTAAVDQEIEDSEVSLATERVLELYKELGGTDQVAKGPSLRDALESSGLDDR
ncbi:MAG: AIPR family protein [Acidobacteriota bacterium]